MRSVAVTRYITPLREGGSLPGLVEADDGQLYVLKFRGAGQGAKALIAEWMAGSLARAAGLRVPELVRAELDPVLGRNEPDPEIRDLINASPGTNLGLGYLAGAIAFDPIAPPQVAAELASQIVWIDALLLNVDRTAKNPNLLIWKDGLYLIDHGASLYFHHDWASATQHACTPFTRIRDHVLLQRASELRRADAALRPRLDRVDLDEMLAAIPDDWLSWEPGVGGASELRAAYRSWLVDRLEISSLFVAEAERARANLL